LAYLDEFQPGSRAEVLARVPAVSRELIECTPRSGWVPIEHDHHTIDAIVDMFGRARATTFWRNSLIHLVDRPLLRNFVAGMLTVMGRNPATVVSFFVKGWSLVYQDMCEPRLVSGESGYPIIRFENVPAAVRVHHNYLLSWEGACRGFAHIARVEGAVSFKCAPDRSWAQAEFSWDRRSESP
jgi:hypothetical protein